jgi:methylated-DNA-protein-cysteine methyltransferase-like protein
MPKKLLDKGEVKKAIISILQKIPFGKVISFGQIANVLGVSPRVVGFVLSGMTKKEMEIFPWFRVVDRNGFISASKLGDKGLLQKVLLEQEGIEIDGFQIMGVERYWWESLS